MKKIEEKKFYFREKISHCRKNWKGGPFGSFQHPFCRKTSKKMQGDPLGEKNFRKKCLAVPKKIKKGDPSVLPGIVCYAGKQKNYFGQFVWIEKKSLK